jgi:ketosteroid isomerase-like protein
MGKTLEERVQLIEDRDEIMRLRIKYTIFNDGGWNGMPTHHGIDGLMEMFAPDAVWDGTPFMGRAEGRDAIRQLMIDFQATPFVMHNVMNPLIDVDGDTARGDWHAIIPIGGDDGSAVWVLGKYEEEYVRLEGRWKFKTVRFVTIVQAPYEKGWGTLVGRS